MQLLFRGTVLYLAFGVAFTFLYHDDPGQAIGDMARRLPDSLAFFLRVGWWVVPLFVVVLLLSPRRALTVRLPKAVVAVFLSSAFFLTFTMVKTSFPQVWPFWADPLMATIDKALHFGTDPWEITHALGFPIAPDAANQLYFFAWLLPATYLPVLLFLFDEDEARIRRFLWLFFFGWAFLGNVVAIGLLSAGPVYYDALLGGDRFAALTAALESSGITGSSVGRTQARLWETYVNATKDPGSGISAFPSVHVAMVTVIALYLGERHRLLGLLGAALVGVFVYLSVWFGWHYAVDGYASILLVVAMWWFLRRRAAAP